MSTTQTLSRMCAVSKARLTGRLAGSRWSPLAFWPARYFSNVSHISHWVRFPVAATEVIGVASLVAKA